MKPIHVLVSTRVTADQLEIMRNIDSRLVIHGEPGGIAIMQAHEVDYKGIDYPEERWDLDVPALLGKAEVIIATRIPPYLHERAPCLRWIQFTSAGIDHLWKPFLDEGKVIVTSAKGIHAIPMREFVLTCLLFFAKGCSRFLQQRQERLWKKFVVEELFGKTLLLIGVGEIGGAVASVGKSLGMYVIGVRRHLGPETVRGQMDEILPITSLPRVLGRADYVVACLPLTPKTQRLLDQEAFRAMKPSAIFVNVGRGRTVDEAALIQSLREGWIAGAALDVYEKEPLPPDSPLWDMPNVLLSPHMGADTARYMERVSEVIYNNLRRYAKGESLCNVVDPVERY